MSTAKHVKLPYVLTIVVNRILGLNPLPVVVVLLVVGVGVGAGAGAGAGAGSIVSALKSFGTTSLETICDNSGLSNRRAGAETEAATAADKEEEEENEEEEEEEEN